MEELVRNLSVIIPPSGFSENGTNESFVDLFTGNATKKSPLPFPNESEYIFDRLWVRAIFITVYSIVFLSCFFGNLIVIMVINLHWRMRSITNFCLGNLAFANLCVGVFCVYQNLSTYLITSWVFGDFMCKMYHFINSLSHTASILILVVICIERYLAIIHPIKCRQILTLNRLRVCIAAVWIISAIYCSPKLYYITTITIPRTDGAIEILCIPKRTLYDSQTFDIINFLLLFLFPLAVISIQYTIIGITLWKSSRNHIMSPRTESSSSFNASTASLDHHGVCNNGRNFTLQNGTNSTGANGHPRTAQPIEADDIPSTPTSPTDHAQDEGNASCFRCFQQQCLFKGKKGRRRKKTEVAKKQDTLYKSENDELNCTQEEILEGNSPVASISIAVETQLAILFSTVNIPGQDSGPTELEPAAGRRVSQRVAAVPDRNRKNKQTHQQQQQQHEDQRSKLFRFRQKMKGFRMDDCCEGGRNKGSQGQQLQQRQQQGQVRSNQVLSPSSSSSSSSNFRSTISGPPGGQLKLRRRGGIKNARFGAQALQSRRRVVRMLIAIVVTFALCNLPFHGRKLWQIWSSSYKGGSMFSTLFTPITFIIMYANCAINPILYAFMSKTFRLSLVELFCCRMKRRHTNNNNNRLHRQESVVTSAHLA